MLKKLTAVLFLTVLVAGCGGTEASTPDPTDVAEVSQTLAPQPAKTATLEPTETPLPTATPTAVPTPKPTPEYIGSFSVLPEREELMSSLIITSPLELVMSNCKTFEGVGEEASLRAAYEMDASGVWSLSQEVWVKGFPADMSSPPTSLCWVEGYAPNALEATEEEVPLFLYKTEGEEFYLMAPRLDTLISLTVLKEDVVGLCKEFPDYAPTSQAGVNVAFSYLRELVNQVGLSDGFTVGWQVPQTSYCWAALVVDEENLTLVYESPEGEVVQHELSLPPGERFKLRLRYTSPVDKHVALDVVLQDCRDVYPSDATSGEALAWSEEYARSVFLKTVGVEPTPLNNREVHFLSGEMGGDPLGDYECVAFVYRDPNGDEFLLYETEDGEGAIVPVVPSSDP